MKAFVLSGGANYGALQAGALTALLEHGIQPDLLVGVSAGALNAAWLATYPTLSGARQLESIWREAAPKIFQSPSHLSMLYRLAQGRESLLASISLQRFICKWVPYQIFGDFEAPRLYVLAVQLADGTPRLFGNNPSDHLLDGLMASTALPPLFPPWMVDGVPYYEHTCLAMAGVIWIRCSYLVGSLWVPASFVGTGDWFVNAKTVCTRNIPI